MRTWLRHLWERLTGQPVIPPPPPPPAPPPAPQREHMPELHAFKQRQTVYGGRADLQREQIRRALAAEVYEQAGRERGDDGR